MFEAFEKLPQEKKQKIVKAAMKEFAKNGYRKGSTNIIVKEADISKGILYHYFGSKKNLYLYLLDYALDYFSQVFLNYIEETEEKDLFEKLKGWGLVKVRVFSEDRCIHEFMTRTVLSPDKEIEQEITQRTKDLYQKNMTFFLKDIDLSVFRKDIVPNKSIEFIMSSLNSIADQYIERYKGRQLDIWEDKEKLLKDMDDYISLLKWGVYGHKE